MMASTEYHSGRKLLEWYRDRSTHRLDLIGDFAGKELFAFDANSLLLYCVAQANVDFTENGFQLLHAIYAVEDFLRRLHDRGCSFHLIFFREYEEMSIPAGTSMHNSSKYLLTSRILFHHLKHQCPDEETSALQDAYVYEFARPDAPAFAEYLKANAVRCYIGLDGDVSNGVDTLAQARYVHVLYQALKLDIRVAVLNDLEIRNNKVSIICPDFDFPRCYFADPAEVFANVIEPVHHVGRVFEIEHSGYKSLIVAGQIPVDEELRTKLEGYSVREKISVAAVCKLVSKDSANNVKLEVVAIVLHLMGLHNWALADRNCKVAQIKKKASLDGFFRRLRAILEWCSPNSWLFQGTWDLFDLFDGRVFLNVYTGVRDKRAFPETMITDAKNLLRIIEDVTKAELICHLPPVMGISEGERITSGPSPHQYLMLPFSQPVFNQYLPDVDLELDKGHVHDKLNRVFEELLHWHKAKSSLDHKHHPKPDRLFARQKNQEFMASTKKYSESLANQSNPETIVVRKPHSKGVPKGHSTTAKNAGPKSKGPKPKSQRYVNGRQRALETGKAEHDLKDQKKAGSILGGWISRCEDFEKKPLAERYRLALRYLGGLRKQDIDLVGSEIQLYVCNILCRIWGGLVERKMDHKATVMHIAGLIYHHSTTAARSPGCKVEISDTVQEFAKLLRLPGIPIAESSGTSRPLPFELYPLDDLRSPLAAVELQLQCCGPYLERSFDSRDDERVSFSPDAWQRDVLDAIDAEKSLLVIAPTSAGKTFISFYAMKKVLQFDDDGVIAYVAPTKALVNQIAAEIQARFKKEFKYPNGRSVWAIHTRDYRVNNPTGCQILVTVPHILQTLLLSPTNGKKKNPWTQRVRHIIFDEVHCIGQSEEGVVWEQLILMAPCPIIALSATVGNPNTFYKWLKATQEQHGRSLCMIKHDSRYSDLRKFVYAVPKIFKFTGLQTLDRLPTPGLQDTDREETAFRQIHPVATLKPGYEMVRTNPPFRRDHHALNDITLEPQDCLILWKAMVNAKVKNIQSLDPLRIFSGLTSKAAVVEWETRLKHMLGHLMTTDKERFDQLRSETLKTQPQPLTREDPFKRDEDTRPRSEKYQKWNHTMALPLLSDLYSHDGLPAIIFNHERHECEMMMRTVTKELQASEIDYKKSSPEWKQKMAEYKMWKQRRAAKEVAAKEAERKKSNKAFKLTSDGRRRDEPNKTLKDERSREREANNLSRWASFNPEAPLDEFSFADKTKLTNSDLEEEFLKPLKVPREFLDALKRGIGVHHAGMNRQYRQVVEILFRKGFLRVVIATGTLALGINMPCRTVVFMGDSVFHTALNYRQASGRAGRRGFDLLGNVVFAGIKPQRVFDIMSSKLPDLRGQFALSTTLILRVLGLLHATKNAPYAVNIAKSLLTQNQLFLGGPESKLFVQHHLCFSIEYLRRQNLLSSKGAPTNFAGLVGHLYFTENAAFAFHALLKEGYFHKLCANIRSKRDEVLEELALVMAHLFSRVHCTNAVRRSVIERTVSPSILLPNLPTNAERVLREHNKNILSIFTSYATTFARMHLKDVPDRVLPYTQHTVGPEKSGGHGGLDRLQPCFLRSPFAALSGHDDRFSSTKDLCNNVQSGVFMEESAIPSLPIAPHDTGGPLNGYLFNFYKHGDLEALSSNNKIHRGSVYIILKDFTLILSTIVASLKNYTNTDAIADDEDIIGIHDEMDSDDERGNGEAGGSDYPANGASSLSWADAKHGTLEYVQEAFAMLLKEYDNKLLKHAS
ncbi:hypothetical protein PG984_000718 [Apiospora sp. TS-2023a]